ncbi:MAG: hypothetical protein KC468_24095 [Myxococcales bacterium]|nr:hypothetical protein [Myxococcales bacterium]
MKDQHREMLRDLISDRLSIPQDLCGLTPPRPRVAPPAPPAPALTVVTNERATPSTRVVEPPTLALVPSPTQVSAGEPTLTDTTAPVAAIAPAPVAAVTPAPPMSRPTSTPASAPLEIQATARAASAPASARAVRARSSSSPTRRIRAAIARINALLSCDDDGCPLRALGVAIAVLLGSGVERYISNDALEMLKTQQGRLIRELVRSAAYFDDSLRSDCVALTALLSQQLAAPAANA